MSISQWAFAAAYDLLNSTVEGRVAPYRRRTAGVASGDVLEVGGGTGANLGFYPRDARLTFLDPNPHMSVRLRRRASDMHRGVTLVSGLGERLPFGDGSFDTVVTTLVLCMVSDLRAVVAEIRRVVKPGGAFLFYEHVVSERPFGRRCQSVLNPLWRLATTGCNLDRDISAAIRQGGFEEVELTRFDLSVGLPVTIPNIVGVARS